jgi:hypothetical protein
VIRGVDLAHVGRQFGDREPITDEFLKWVESEDQELVNRLAALDAPGFSTRSPKIKINAASAASHRFIL